MPDTQIINMQTTQAQLDVSCLHHQFDGRMGRKEAEYLPTVPRIDTAQESSFRVYTYKTYDYQHFDRVRLCSPLINLSLIPPWSCALLGVSKHSTQ